MSNYADRLVVGEQAISDFINGRISVGELEKKLGATLSSCKFFNKENSYTVSIVRTDKSKEPFFGARVYPAIDMLEKMVSEVVTEYHPFRDLWTAWQKIDKWVIEIDSAMFDLWFPRKLWLPFCMRLVIPYIPIRRLSASIVRISLCMSI